MRRLERFFAALPERERQVIDAYLGIGLTPTQLAAELKVTPSRVSQMFKALVQRTARAFRPGPEARARPPARSFARGLRAHASRSVSWSSPPTPTKAPGVSMMESALTRPIDRAQAGSRAAGCRGARSACAGTRLRVDSETRWG